MAALVAARREKGMSQRHLSLRLDRAHSFVGKIESGERRRNVLEICEYTDAVEAGAAEMIKSVVKARG
jgi:ribosome-binding protein aMBF1 (putative translation factor)